VKKGEVPWQRKQLRTGIERPKTEQKGRVFYNKISKG